MPRTNSNEDTLEHMWFAKEIKPIKINFDYDADREETPFEPKLIDKIKKWLKNVFQ